MTSMHIILDFDGTITQRDTIGVLAESAIERQKQRRGGGKDLQAVWDGVVKDYVEDYASFETAYVPIEKDRTTDSQEQEFLRAAGDVEVRSLSRVAAAGIFAGFTNDDFFQMGKEAVESGKIAYRAGFTKLMDLAAQNRWSVSVVSVNWSESFIQGAIHPYEAMLWANTINPEGEIKGPALLDGRLSTSSDKWGALCYITGMQTSGGRHLYFGDSTTDFGCVMDGGVVISPDEHSPLMKVLRRVGKFVPHVADVREKIQLCWARDFDEILQQWSASGE